MSETLVDIKGMLFVRLTEPDYERPVLRETFYPTGVASHWNPDILGQAVTYRDGGTYLTPSGRAIRLLHGGETTPDPAYTVETPIPAPKRAKKSRYTSGRWEVWTERGGWRAV